MKRLSCGVPGIDAITKGGIPEGHILLLSGAPGTGKTTFCVQFIYEGLKKSNENGLFVSFEETPDSMREAYKEMGFDFAPYERSGRFSFLNHDPYHIEEVFDILESAIRDTGARRVVIDSISALGLHVRDKAELRRMIFNLSTILKKLGCTAILVSEIVPGSSGISRYGVEEFVADSVIVLYYERNNLSFSRAIQVWKMRGSDHSNKLHPYKITEKGVIVRPEEEAFVRE